MKTVFSVIGYVCAYFAIAMFVFVIILKIEGLIEFGDDENMICMAVFWPVSVPFMSICLIWMSIEYIFKRIKQDVKRK